MENIKKAIDDILGNAASFILSRRLWLLGFVGLVLTLLGYLGLPVDLQASIVEQLGRTTDSTVELLVVARAWAIEMTSLIGMLVLAYKTLASWTTRPPTVDDYKNTRLSTGGDVEVSVDVNSDAGGLG